MPEIRVNSEKLSNRSIAPITSKFLDQLILQDCYLIFEILERNFTTQIFEPLLKMLGAKMKVLY